MKSIRTFLLTRLLGGAALILTVAGLAVYLVATRSLEAQYDRNLSDRVQGFASILFQVEDEVSFEFSDELMPEYDPGARADYFQLWFANGELIERSNSLEGADLPFPEGAVPELMHWTAALPDGRPGRFVSQEIEVHHVYPEQGPDRPQAASVVVVVARGRETLIAAERKLLGACAAVALALLALIGFLSWDAVKKGLEPTNRLAQTLDAIEADNLPEHLDVGALPSELAPFADTTDALIQRVETALLRERRTSADIAHELRTPISELITVAEVALRDPDDSDESRRALETIRDVAWRMGHSVSTLLKLARLEMGTETFDRGGVELGSITRELLRTFSAIERERDLSVVNQVGAGDLVDGDADVLRIIVSNLLSNALYYSPPHGSVECRLERRGGSVGDWRFLVENEAADLRDHDLLALSQPFWRKDRARADRNRSGLGLALSCALAERTGMELTFQLEDGTFQAILTSPGPTNGRDEPPAAADAAGSNGHSG